MDLNNIVGFKAVDKNGKERQVTVDEMTELVSARIVSAASEISTFAAAAAAGTDEFEDQLPQSDTFSWLRTLDGSKNPTLTSSSAAAKVLGGLLGINQTLGDKGYPTSVADANDVGYYTIDDRLTNEDTPNGHRAWGGLLVFGRLFITQIYIPMNDNVFYIRQKLGDNWGKWAKYEGVFV